MSHQNQIVNEGIKDDSLNTCSSRNEQAIQLFLSTADIDWHLENLNEQLAVLARFSGEIPEEVRDSICFTHQSIRSLLKSLS
ncbi:hypothetical protein AWW68_18835 [Roseivirga spongicola]|uniref:Uncharacterized protein n=1 Tax=Roseivirga spongicola TaxID=333140 RepID=A0A150XE03_9BACT|nr:hypothetical protein AWW68_18835 [Roseivirga spongicola]